MKDEEILKQIGAKLKELRVERNMKQKELSERSGLSMFSISQIETGHNTSMLSLVQILKALDHMEMLEPFLKAKEVDPELLAEFIRSQQQPVRQRVTTPRASTSAAEAPTVPHAKVKSYFDEEEAEDPNARMVADDSEYEYGKK